MPLRHVRLLLGVFFALLASTLLAGRAEAANCNYATSQGSTGPANWQTYCWLDFAGYNNTTARSSAGQNFSYTLPDGTVMTFNMKVSGANMTGAASPSWAGAAIGNTAFLGIGGRPILYQTAAGTTTVTISSITLTPPAAGRISNFMLVAADGESSNQGESLRFQTNGGAWQMLDQAGPISGSVYPSQSGIGTNTFTTTGVAGTVGAYVVGSTNPGQIVTQIVGGGLQGVMFAVRFASIRLDTQIGGARIQAADQFAFSINATGSGATLASGTSSGTALGPFPAAALSSTAALPLTLNLAMAGGSSSPLSRYESRLTCTNGAVSSTLLPNSVVTASYNFGSLQFGDAVVCRFTVTPFPHLTLRKALGAGGRQFNSDQFTLQIMSGSAAVASATTGGSGTSLSNPATPQTQLLPGTSYVLTESPAGTAVLSQYTATMVCTNAASTSSTTLPAAPGAAITPQMGDVITCTITNTRRPANASLEALKRSRILSDPANGASNPKAIPGAVVVYSIEVRNTGPSPVDLNSVFIIDALPSELTVGAGLAPSFTQGATASGLTFNPSADLRFSNAVTPPASFAACTYTPVGAYDPNVRFVCINPKGSMAGSSGSPPSFTLSFQSLIK